MRFFTRIRVRGVREEGFGERERERGRVGVGAGAGGLYTGTFLCLYGVIVVLIRMMDVWEDLYEVREEGELVDE